MSTFNLAIFQPPTVSGDVFSQTLATPGTGGREITGPEKLANRFLLELLTIKGSMRFLTSHGSSLMSDLSSGRVLSEFDVFVAFGHAIYDVGTNLLNEDVTTDPLNEQFASASLTGLNVTTDSIQMSIAVQNKAGDVNVVNIPLTVIPEDPGSHFEA